LIGSTIAHYRVEKKIGEGGMGEVYLAEDTRLNRKVALKVLPEALQQDSISHKRFIREARSAAALDHPFVCKIYEVGEHEGRNFIAMEYLKGQTLKERLGQGHLPLEEALKIGLEISEALEEAHERGIVHRDLKPSNIMYGNTTTSLSGTTGKDPLIVSVSLLCSNFISQIASFLK